MKKLITLIVVISLIMFNVGFIPQAYAGEISAAESAAKTAGETAGAHVEDVIEIGGWGWASVILLIIAGFAIGSAGDDDDTKRVMKTPPQHLK
jgi:hypothetical protein